MSSKKLILALVVFVLLAGAGVTAGLAYNNQQSPAAAVATTTDCSAQAGQLGPNEEQNAADEVSGAAADVEQEAADSGPDDQAGDQQGPNDQSDEQGESGASGASGPSGEQGDSGQCGDQSGD